VLYRAIAVGVVGGALTAWIGWSSLIPDAVAFHTVALTLIAAIYLGFAFQDGRVSIVILEMSVATGFVVLALLGLWLAPAFLAVGLILLETHLASLDRTAQEVVDKLTGAASDVGPATSRSFIVRELERFLHLQKHVILVLADRKPSDLGPDA